MTTFAQTHKLNLSDVAIVQALVYNSESNCAQLKRTFQLELAAGYNEVKVQVCAVWILNFYYSVN